MSFLNSRSGDAGRSISALIASRLIGEALQARQGSGSQGFAGEVHEDGYGGGEIVNAIHIDPESPIGEGEIVVDGLSRDQAEGFDRIVAICKRTISDLRTQVENQKVMLERAESDAFKWEGRTKDLYEAHCRSGSDIKDELGSIHRLLDPKGENTELFWPNRGWVYSGQTYALVQDLVTHHDADKATIAELQQQLADYRNRAAQAVNDALGTI